MFIFAMLMGLVFLVAGGGGLFYTLVNIPGGTDLWVVALIGFSTFVVFGIGLLIFLAIFNTEFD